VVIGIFALGAHPIITETTQIRVKNKEGLKKVFKLFIKINSLFYRKPSSTRMNEQGDSQVTGEGLKSSFV
jgi:hypothetical protein